MEKIKKILDNIPEYLPKEPTLKDVLLHSRLKNKKRYWNSNRRWNKFKNNWKSLVPDKIRKEYGLKLLGNAISISIQDSLHQKGFARELLKETL